MDFHAPHRGRLLIACQDQPGIIRAISDALYGLGGNIVSSDQYSEDPDHGMFFMRTEFDLAADDMPRSRIQATVAPIADRFQMQWRLSWRPARPRIAIFVSNEDHCLNELLYQCQTGEIPAVVTGVISNHDTCRRTVDNFQVPYHYIPVTAQSRIEAETQAARWLHDQEVDLIVLARYMQILSPGFVNQFTHRMINIHHSFLPAFVGPNPYRQAFDRGVKLIGATAHYVTSELDAGPIIEQDVQRVDHRHRVQDLRRLGRHVERMVLARAVRWHLEDRVWVHQHRTVVFP